MIEARARTFPSMAAMSSFSAFSMSAVIPLSEPESFLSFLEDIAKKEETKGQLRCDKNSSKREEKKIEGERERERERERC
jgi:hypothetical protein